MKKTSIYKILYLYKLLLDKDKTKQEIKDDFKNIDILLRNTTFFNYIKKLESCGIEIENNSKKYKIIKNNSNFSLDNDDIEILYQIKQLLFAQKKYKYIKILIDLFVRLSVFIEDENKKDEFLNFGYFSSVNWNLVEILEKHCENKDVLLLDYLLSCGGNKIIEFHVKEIELSKSNQRMYLIGVLKNGTGFFRLPIDRIYRVNRVLRKNVDFKIESEIIQYKIKKDAFLSIDLEKNEKVIDRNNQEITLEAKVEDEFQILQRLMYLSCDLTFLSDGKIKEKYKEKLEMVRKSYEQDYNQ